MKEIYKKLLLKVKNAKLKKAGEADPFLTKILINIITFFIILTNNSGEAFSLVIQDKNSKLETHSYKQFKGYQKNIRLLMLLVLVLLLVLLILMKKILELQ